MKIKISFFVVMALILTLCSCQRSLLSPRTATLAMAEACEDRAAGSVYTTESSYGAPDHLSPELMAELFGDFDFTGVNGAVYLSGTTSLFELSFFDCPDTDTAEAVGGLCAARFDLASKTAKRMGLDESDFTVKIYGRRVLAAMCEESERAVSAGLEKIKGQKSLFNMKKG